MTEPQGKAAVVKKVPPWRDKWTVTAFCFFVVGTMVAAYFSFSSHKAPVGVLVGAMGLVAAGVTFRDDPKPRAEERALWLLLMTFLLFAEIRNDHLADKAQEQKFESIRTSLAESANSFTGDGSYCYVNLILGMPDMPVMLFQQGRFHVWDAVPSLLDQDVFMEAVRQDQPLRGVNGETGAIQLRQVPIAFRGFAQQVGSLPGIPDTVEEKNYSANVVERNGSVQELIRLKRSPETHQWSESVLVAVSFYDGRKGIVLKQIGTVPPTDKDWLDMEKSPTLTIKEETESTPTEH